MNFPIDFERDDANRRHVLLHGIQAEEAEQVLLNEPEKLHLPVPEHLEQLLHGALIQSR